MLVMVVFFIAFRWIHLSTQLIRLFLLVLILLLMPTLNFLPVLFDLSILLYRLPSRVRMLFIIFFVVILLFFFVVFYSSSYATSLPTCYYVYPLYGRHDAVYYTVKDCVTIDVLPRTPGNNVYVGFMVWSNFTATKYRGLDSLNQVIKEIICLQPLK